MDLAPFSDRLSPRRIEMLASAIAKLETGIAAGAVRNADFTGAKEIINWSADDAEEAFLKDRRDWWLAAYDFDAFVQGTHNMPTVLKRARKHRGLTEYADFIESALLPLHALLQACKPLIVKRQTGPGAPKTAAQIEREAATMTCQCCGNRYLANTGTIAHHGYQRPGNGWQSASCDGAKALPFEVSRDRLGSMIERLKNWEIRAVADRKAVSDETKPVTTRFQGKKHGWGHEYESVDVSRDTFQDLHDKRHGWFLSHMIHTFDELKDSDLCRRDQQIKGVRSEIKAQQARFDSWNKTHGWNGHEWKLSDAR